MALGRKIVETEVFGEQVYIRTLNGGATTAQAIDLLSQVGAKPSLITELGALLVVACLCDSEGSALYDDVDAVREEAAVGFLTEFVEKALDISGLKDDAEEVRKNSQAVQ